jgi:hypothetical protein
VEDRAGLEVAVGDGHVQGVSDQAGAHVVRELPAGDHLRGQVDNGRQVQPPIAGLEVGDVTHQPGAGRCGGEVPADQVRAGHWLLTGQRGALISPRLAGP